MPYSTISYPVSPSNTGKHSSIPVFEGAKDINLLYILNNKKNNVPERILRRITNIVNTREKFEFPTLIDLHLKTYAKLLDCKTLTDAQRKFPEFNEVLDINVLNKRRMKFLNDEEVNPQGLSLRLLQEYYGKLKTQAEIIMEMKFPSKQSLQSVMEKIKFPVFPKNYRILITASDEKGNAEIARKVRAYNQLHPDLVRVHNKMAAQGTKTEKYRKEQSVRIKKYDKEHPERRAKIGLFYKEVWSRIPEIKAALKDEFRFSNPVFYSIAQKERSGQKLNEKEIGLKKEFFKKFWDRYPDFKKLYKQTCQEVSKENTYGQR